MIIYNDIFIKNFIKSKRDNKTIINNNLLDLIGIFNNKEYLESNLNSQIMISGNSISPKLIKSNFCLLHQKFNNTDQQNAV